MSIRYEIQILRSKLIALMRLTQRTVDYSIKAFQLGRPELNRAVQNFRDEMSAISGWIANHGHTLLAAGTTAGADWRFVCAALRITTALEVACDAAFNVARYSAIRFAEGWTPVSAELENAGDFVNSLLRLCVLSLLKRDVAYAKEVLQNESTGQSFDLVVYLAHHDLAQRLSDHARYELALVRCMDRMTGPIHEIADALLQWHEETERSGVAVDAVPQQTTGLAHNACTLPVSGPASSCKLLGFAGAIPQEQALRLSAPNVDCFRSHAAVGIAPTEHVTQARVSRLQQRVCELLVKNQQLRMALLVERAESFHDQLC